MALKVVEDGSDEISRRVHQQIVGIGHGFSFTDVVWISDSQSRRHLLTQAADVVVISHRVSRLSQEGGQRQHRSDGLSGAGRLRSRLANDSQS